MLILAKALLLLLHMLAAPRVVSSFQFVTMLLRKSSCSSSRNRHHHQCRAAIRSVTGATTSWMGSMSAVTTTTTTTANNKQEPLFPAAPLFSTLRESSQTSNNDTSFGERMDGNNSNNYKIPTNRELAEQRIAAGRAKREALIRSARAVRARNLKFKQILHDDINNNNDDDEATEASATTKKLLFAVKVFVCNELRETMKLSGREKRGRIFLEPDSEAVQSLHSLRLELFRFFRALKKGVFVLQGALPTAVAQDGSIVGSPSAEEDAVDDEHNHNLFWDIGTDEDVIRTFDAAARFYEENKNVMKRPSIYIMVKKDPNAPKPPPTPTYLINMPDPKETTSMTMLSFYSFPPGEIEKPEEFAAMLRKVWKPFGVLGRVYVAKEGVNAQMSVPTNVLDNFVECCRSIPELGQYMENGINIDPIPLSMEEFAVAGAPQVGGGDDGVASSTPNPPFRNLHVRVRGQIVADGLDKPLNWQSAGYDMPPMEWHQALKNARDKATGAEEGTFAPAAPVILDCRNNYETDVGIFEGAEPLGTVNFRESWDMLKERLANTPKDAPIMTYCTGGIRCVKVGAYLTQEMGFTNVSRLAGGIIAYDRTLQQEISAGGTTEKPLFKGTNFVFDGRLGRPITEDAMGVCITCGSETALVSNCRNGHCHKRMIQCESCKTSFHGTCSDACRNRLLHGSSVQRFSSSSSSTVVGGDARSTAATSTTTGGFASLDEYSSGFSTPPPSLYREIEFNTKALIPSGTHMVSGESQGRLLKQLASMTRTARVLELGTFTGYATSCLLEGVANAAQVIGTEQTGSRQQGPYLMSMERDAKAFHVAVAHMKVVTEHGFGEAAAEALCAMRSNSDEKAAATPPVVVSDTVVSLPYGQGRVGCEMLHVSDALATLEEMAAGRGNLTPGAPFDLVFVDADKTRLLEYVDTCLSSDSILNKGGLIVVDNVLWKGLVLEASGDGEFHSLSSSFSSDEDDVVVVAESAAELRKNRRARKLARTMHQFNNAVATDNRAEVLVLPLRDGLSIIRKK